MKVRDVMTFDVRIAVPEMDIADAARLMAELDVGVLPVCDAGRLVGIVTDRDIAVRGVALRLGCDTRVDAVMSPAPRFCYDDDALEEALAGMGHLQVRRLPVLNRAHELVGILSLSDAAFEAPPPVTGEVLADISEPGGPYSQSDDEDPSSVVAPPVPETGDDEILPPPAAPIHFSTNIAIDP